MSALLALLDQKPMRIRTVETFVAKNPWTQSEQEEWSLELFRMAMPLSDEGEFPEVSVEKRQSEKAWGLPISLKMNELLGLRSNSDGNIYLMPYSLTQCYQRQEVPLPFLPRILQRLGKFRKYDFVSPLRNRIVVGLAFFFIFMFLGIQGCILHQVSTGHMHIERGFSVWHLGMFISPVLIFGLVFLWIGLSRLSRYSKQVQMIRNDVHHF